MNLISKKDLLAITGISYGQLYRWKRERLIPEEWFIKQSAYTGQETFFPREQILSRIKSIIDLKDTYSLEELAKMLSPESSGVNFSHEDLNQVEELDKELLDVMPEIFNKERFEFSEVALAAAISQTRKKIGLTGDQAADLLSRSSAAASSIKTVSVCCTVFYSDEEYHTLFSPNALPVVLDDSIEIKDQISLSEKMDALKIKYRNLFIKL